MLEKSFNLHLGLTCADVKTHSSCAELPKFLLSTILMYTRDTYVHNNKFYFVIAIGKHQLMILRKVMAKPWKTEFLSYLVHPTKVIKGGDGARTLIFGI
jgi:hypothetical protein